MPLYDIPHKKLNLYVEYPNGRDPGAELEYNKQKTERIYRKNLPKFSESDSSSFLDETESPDPSRKSEVAVLKKSELEQVHSLPPDEK